MLYILAQNTCATIFFPLHELFLLQRFNNKNVHYTRYMVRTVCYHFSMVPNTHKVSTVRFTVSYPLTLATVSSYILVQPVQIMFVTHGDASTALLIQIRLLHSFLLYGF